MSRRGSNPSKQGQRLPAFGQVRLIIPVYLPSSDGYYADGLRVFETMVDSIEATADDRVLVTVIDNACGPEVRESLEHLVEGRVDRLVRNRSNRGKVDAVLAELNATFEPVIVVADADVVFRPGWVDAVHEGFGAFPECGLLSLHPAPDLRWHASSSILVGARSRKAHLVQAPVVEPGDLERFAMSVGRVATVQPAEGQLLVERDGHALMLGFAHFAFALRRAAVADLPSEPCRSTEDGVDARYFELPADQAGWWCATVLWALVHHIGNTLDQDEEARIASFAASVAADHAPGLPAARRAAASRRSPEIVHRLVTKAARWAYGHRRTTLRLAPVRDVARTPSSATRISEIGPQSTHPTP